MVQLRRTRELKCFLVVKPTVEDQDYTGSSKGMTTTAAGEATTAFAFKPGDLVLIKWNDSMVYFAKIKKIDQRRRKCTVVFDDKSQDEADFSQIHSGTCGGSSRMCATTTTSSALSHVLSGPCFVTRVVD